MKFIKCLALFFLLNGAVVFLFETLYKGHNNTYDIIFKDITKNKNAYTDIYIGNSHTQALQTYTNKMNAVVLNIATPGQDLFKTYTILKKWVPLLNNVNSIYVGLDYEMLGQNLSLSGLAYEDRQLYKYTDTLYENNMESILMAKSNFFRANRDIKFLFYGDDLSVNKNYIPPVIQLNDEDCRKRALEHSQIRFKKNLVSENMNFLLGIIDVAKTNNKKLIFFNPPKSPCFIENSVSENIKFAKFKIDSVFSKNNIDYYSFYNDFEFSKDNFLDYDHLNEQGRIKLVKKINLQAYNQ
jgi:hypothetical protein